MPKGMKIINKNNNILFGSSLTARVDYDEDQLDDEINDKNYSLDEYEEIGEEIKNDYQLTDDSDKIDQHKLEHILDQQYAAQTQKETNEGETEEYESTGSKMEW